MVETSRIELIDELSRLEAHLKEDEVLRSEISDAVHLLRDIDGEALTAAMASLESALGDLEAQTKRSQKFAEVRASLLAIISLASGLAAAVVADAAASIGPRLLLLAGGSLASAGVASAATAAWFLFMKIKAERDGPILDQAIAKLQSYLSLDTRRS
ncbi:hypothetical protein LVY75_12430 [Sinorhizobium sp. B11]